MSRTRQLLSGRCGKIEAASVGDYVNVGGFKALKKAFAMRPQEIVDEVKAAKLLGRGGAAYPAGSKWQHLLEVEESPKYIVCNADEGEPGTFKDKLLLSQDPLSVIEGMTIAGYVFGSAHGFIYIRGEYRMIQKAFQEALDQAVEAGFLGENIMGSGYSYTIHVMTGAGAYVCGENSALLNSIEGAVGRPRIKPPHLAEVGLYKMPTLVNNVESFANIPAILLLGAEEYLKLGAADCGGTKLICLCGHTVNRGVFEIPLGSATLREIIFDPELGGGISDGGKLKFFHLGGQSGPCGFPHQLDTNYVYKDLRSVGLDVGSGAVVVMDDSVCIIDYLKKVMEFFIHESCGKCTPCREGNIRILELLNKISKFQAAESDLELLRRLSKIMAAASFCGLGQTATTALESCLKNAMPEFEAHLNGQCPAGVCSKKEKAGEK